MLRYWLHPWRLVILLAVASVSLAALLAGAYVSALLRHHQAVAALEEMGVYRQGLRRDDWMVNAEWEWLEEWSPGEAHDISIDDSSEVDVQHVLALAARLNDVETVYFGQRRLSRADWQAVARLPSVNTLSLYEMDLRPEELRELRGMRSLTRLDLSYTYVGDDLLRELAHFDHLESLNVALTNITEPAIRAFADGRTEPLIITWCPQPTPKQAAEMEALAKLDISVSPHWTDGMISSELMWSVVINAAQPGDAVETAARLKAFGKVTDLHLYGDSDDDNLAAACAALTTLEEVHINGNNVSGYSLRRLLMLPKLQKMVLNDGRFLPECVAELHSLRPGIVRAEPFRW